MKLVSFESPWVLTSDIEKEVNDVTILYDVFLAFAA